MPTPKPKCKPRSEGERRGFWGREEESLALVVDHMIAVKIHRLPFHLGQYLQRHIGHSIPLFDRMGHRALPSIETIAAGPLFEPQMVVAILNDDDVIGSVRIDR